MGKAGTCPTYTWMIKFISIKYVARLYTGPNLLPPYPLQYISYDPSLTRVKSGSGLSRKG